jgi:hypothetical protein
MRHLDIKVRTTASLLSYGDPTEFVSEYDLPPSVKPTLLLGVTFAGQGC